MSTISQCLRDMFDNPAAYRIRVLGRVAPDCVGCLQGMSAETTAPECGPPETVLEGVLRDQAALAAVLDTLYRQHLPVLTVELIRFEGTHPAP